MSSVHYKFRSSLEYDTLSFDGPSISLSDLRDAIMVQKKFGKNSDFTLEVTNAQTKEVYQDPQSQIPRNTSVVVKRVPVARLAAVTGKTIDPASKETGDLANANASENDKITAMMQQSGELFQPDQYVNNKIRPGAGYICYRCGNPGHYIRNCPTIGDPRYNTPRFTQRSAATEHYIMQMREKEKLASMKANATINRSYSPVVSSDAHSTKEVPAALQCPMCKKLLNDAVVIPCCGTSYCDDCIRNYLIDNDFSCHSCKEKTSPDNIIPNKSLRKAVENFKITSHLASTSAPQTSTPSSTVDTIVKTEDKPTKPKISITLLKRNEPKPKEEKEEPKSADDTLNTSAGPLTDAQLFEQIVKDTKRKNEEEEKKLLAKEEESKIEVKKEDETQDVKDSKTDNEATDEVESKASDVVCGVNESKTSEVADQPSTVTSLPQTSTESAAQEAHIASQSQQLQLQQQQLQLQQQQFNAHRAQLLDQAQLQSVGLVGAESLVLQSAQQPLASMSLVSTVNPALAAQHVNVSGTQLVGPTLPSVAVSQGIQQRLVVPGSATHLNPVANLGQTVAHPAQPVVGLSMATAFVPDSIHSVIPKILPSGIATHSGRSAIPSASGRLMLDRLFDLSSSGDSSTLPMSEEEFYRMKIKLKDSQKGRRRRSGSRSPSKPDSHRSSKDSRSRRRDRSRSHDRKESRDRHRSHDRHRSQDKHRSSKERSESRSKSRKHREYERHVRTSPRPEDYLKRKKKEKLAVLLKDYDSFDDEEHELVDNRHSERHHRYESASRSRSKTFSPESISIDREPKAPSNRSVGDSWSRSPSPQMKEEKYKDRRDNFSGEEFETVKLEDVIGTGKESRPDRKKKSRDGRSEKAKERKSRKRKSKEIQDVEDFLLKKRREEDPEEEVEKPKLEKKMKKKIKLEKQKKKDNDKQTLKVKKKMIVDESAAKVREELDDFQGKISKKKRNDGDADGKKKGKKGKLKKSKKKKEIENITESEVEATKEPLNVSSNENESKNKVEVNYGKKDEELSNIAGRADENIDSCETAFSSTNLSIVQDTVTEEEHALSVHESEAANGFLAVNEAVTESISEAVTEDITKGGTDAITKNVTEDITEAVSKTMSETVTETVTKAVTENVIEAVTENVTEDITEAVSKTTSETVTETVTKAVTENVIQAVTENVTEGITETVLEVVTEDVTGPITKNVTENVTEGITKDVTEAVTETVSGAVTETVTEAVTEDSIEAVAESVTEDITDNVTDNATETFFEDVTKDVTEAVIETASEAITETVTKEAVTEAITETVTKEAFPEDVTEIVSDAVTETQGEVDSLMKSIDEALSENVTVENGLLKANENASENTDSSISLKAPTVREGDKLTPVDENADSLSEEMKMESIFIVPSTDVCTEVRSTELSTVKTDLEPSICEVDVISQECTDANDSVDKLELKRGPNECTMETEDKSEKQETAHTEDKESDHRNDHEDDGIVHKEATGNSQCDVVVAETKATPDNKIEAVSDTRSVNEAFDSTQDPAGSERTGLEVEKEIAKKAGSVQIDNQWRGSKGFASEASEDGQSSQNDSTEDIALGESIEADDNGEEDDDDDDDDEEEEDDDEDEYDDEDRTSASDDEKASDVKNDAEDIEVSQGDQEVKNEHEDASKSEAEGESDENSSSEVGSEADPGSETEGSAEAEVESEAEADEEEAEVDEGEAETDEEEAETDEQISGNERMEKGSEGSSNEVLEEEVVQSFAKSSKHLTRTVENEIEDSTEESASEAETKRAAKKKKRKKEKKRRSKKKKRIAYSEDEDDDSDSEDESEDDKKRRKRKRTEKKAKKQKRKHKKRKHAKKHRKSKKYEEEDDSEVEKERKNHRRKRKSEDSDSEDEVPSKFMKVSKSVKRHSKKRKQAVDLDNSEKIIIDIRNIKRKGEGRDSRTIYIERDNDIRRVEPKRKTKISRTIRA